MYSRYAKATGRILLWLLLTMVLASAALYCFAPPLDNFRPQLEKILKKECKLNSLTLGRLSWGWSGYTWVHADKVHFQLQDYSLTVKNGQFAAQISLFDLLTGKLSPDVIELAHASIHVDFDTLTKSPAQILPKRILLKDTTFHWQYGELSQQLEHLNVDLNHTNRVLQIKLPGTDLNIHWSRQRQPKTFHLSFEDLHWLPESLRQNVRGDVGGEIELHQSNHGQWSVKLGMEATDKSKPATIADNEGENALMFDRLYAEMRLLSNSAFADIHKLKLDSLVWQQNESRLQLQGEWNERLLKIHLVDGQLQMATMWPWLNALGDTEWQSWLASMKHGTGSDMQGKLEIDTAFLQIPTQENWQQMRYHFEGRSHNADIALSPDRKNLLEHVEGSIRLNHHGLWATITDATIPDHVGKITGTFSIPDWKDIVMEIDGRGDVDVVRLLHWLNISEFAAIHWKRAPASGDFSLRWLPGESAPREGNAHIQPVSPWSVQLSGEAVDLSKGQITWDQHANLRIEDMQYEHQLGKGVFNLTAKPDSEADWKVTSFEMQGRGAIEPLMAHYFIPITSAEGEYAVELNWRDHWQGHMTLDRASWSHFFGSKKTGGEKLSLDFSSTAGEKWQLNSSGKTFQVKGDIHRNASFLYLNLDTFITPAIDGSVTLKIPYQFFPLEINLHAKQMRQEVLPKSWPHYPGRKRPWTLQAEIEQLQWGNASIAKLSLNTHSADLIKKGGGLGSFQAETLQVAELSLRNLKSSFRLPQPDIIDIQNMSAQMQDDQKLQLSVTLNIEDDQALQWSGFAHVQGEFSQMINPFDSAKRFESGKVNLLISGSGTLHDKMSWWHDIDGRLRMRVVDGRIREGGITTRLLAFASIADLPKILLFKRKDLIGSGTHYDRLQLEARLHNERVDIHQLAMRASALDMAAKGSMDLKSSELDLFAVMRPLQNLDAILSALPLVRDMLGGAARSLIRKIYHVHGPLSDVKVEEELPENAGLAGPGLIEALLSLPSRWFGMTKEDKTVEQP